MEYGKFTGNYKNDGVSGEFDGLTYPHSQEMLKVCEIFDNLYFSRIYNVIMARNPHMYN